MAYINLVRASDSSLTINVAGLSNDPSYYDSVYVNCNGKTLGTSSFYGSVGNAYSAGIEFTELKPGTEYSCSATVYYRGTSSTFYGSFQTTNASRPENWVWTQTELNAFNKVDGYKISSVTWQRWNAFVERVKAFDKWKNGANSGKYWLDEALMSSDSKSMTAYRFNTVRFAIGSMNSNGSGIPSQSRGMPVMGWYFIQLANRLNSISLTFGLGTTQQLNNMKLLHEIAKIDDMNREM